MAALSKYSRQKLIKRFGKYDVVKQIGRARLGSVWLVRTPNEDLAVKEIFVKGDQELVEFDRERRALTSMPVHENIVHWVDGFISSDEPLCAIIFTRYVNGRPLHRILRNGIVARQRAEKIMKQVARALAHCHRHEIIHHDLSMRNIVVERRTNQTVLIDFGYSTKERKKKVGRGTLAFAAPEVLTNEYQSEKIDIWSWAVIFYRLLEGRLPFSGKTRTELIDQILGPLDDSTRLYSRRVRVAKLRHGRRSVESLLFSIFSRRRVSELRPSAVDIINHKCWS